ncbi:hypothetical protein AK812_SmicGene14684 [Symbiodinium microadriaticum]|uniref:Uncharacterized protein n=1 Tax=Symbiodinium microadriaticum TaxID=2951 RepID=A0A1Q9E4W7_SYMMI|nr:hypothetical protein AK812_SmicGene14684 [Symbiodinium microadriaticum]
MASSVKSSICEDCHVNVRALDLDLTCCLERKSLGLDLQAQKQRHSAMRFRSGRLNQLCDNWRYGPLLIVVVLVVAVVLV